jgi:hypothetical protein
MHRILRFLHPSVLAGNISTLCLWVNLLMLVVGVPYYAATNALWLKSLFQPIMFGAFMFGTVASAVQLRITRIIGN